MSDMDDTVRHLAARGCPTCPDVAGCLRDGPCDEARRKAVGLVHAALNTPTNPLIVGGYIRRVNCDCADRLRAEADRTLTWDDLDLPARDQAARAKRAAWYRLAADYLDRSKR